MSVPRTLDLPAGVEATTVTTPRGTFAVHRASAASPTAGVLLVPGWTGSKEDFTPLLPVLADAGYSAVAYDQRGQFETPGAAGDDYSLSALGRDAAALAAAALPAGPVHLLGHSFGGLVAQQAVIDGPDQWATLSLLCTGPGALGDLPQRRPLQQIVAAIGKVPLLQIHELREKGIKRPAQITAFLARRFTNNAPASLRAMTQHLIDAPDVINQVAATGVPCWVGHGADDDAWPLEVQAEVAARLGGEVQVVPDSAHSPAIENTQGLADLWLPFLAQH